MTQTKHQQMLEDIRSAEGAMGGIKLSNWEAEFVECIEERLAAERQLTTIQGDKLEQIWTRI